MTINKATPKEIPILAEFQQKMAMETENLQLDSETLHSGIEALFNDPSKGSYFVVRDHTKTIGCLMLTYEWSDWRNGTVVWIQSVYVLPEYRGKGVFRMLYTHVQQLVHANPSLRGIRLYVEKENHIAQKVYQAMGMDGEHYQLYEWMK
jgi:ribosomal protein S18 acetylase RimI-like enzyme